jgi:hypothetical protein
MNNFEKTRILLGAFGLVLFSPTQGRSDPGSTTIETIAITGQPAPGTPGPAPGTPGTPFASFDNPGLNIDGDIVFRAILGPGYGGGPPGAVGIWQHTEGGSLNLVAQPGDLVPIQRPAAGNDKAPLLFVGSPRIDDQGGIVFQANLNTVDSDVSQSTDEGLWWARRDGAGADFLLIAREGDAADTNGGNGAPVFEHFGNPVNFPDGAVAFTAELDGISGAWRVPPPQLPSAGEPSLIAMSGQFAPGAGNSTFEALQRPSLGTGWHWAFRAFLQPGDAHSDLPIDNDGIWEGPSSSLSPLARTGQAAPEAGGAHFYALGTPVVNSSNQVAFWGGVDSADASEGVWVSKFGSVDMLALAGGRPPGAPDNAVFAQFFDPVLNEQGVAAFLARFEDDDSAPGSIDGEGIWMGGVAAYLRLIALTGGQVPGLPQGYLFSAFGSPIINEIGQVVFTAIAAPDGEADSEDARTGVWAMTIDGELQSVLASGDDFEVLPADFRQVSSVGVTGFNNNGHIALIVAFADGSSGVLQASLPVPAAAEFDSWAEQITDPGARDSNDDLDGDGIPNILEFAFGLNPAQKDDLEFPRVALLRTGGDTVEPPALTIEFPRIIFYEDVQYVVEVSTDLVTWQSGPNFVAVVNSEITGDGMETVVVRDLTDPALYDRCFIRVRVAY